MNEYDISRAFKRIENDLMDSMIRNLKRHKAEETEEGFNWEQWQALQLKDLERYRAQNRDKFTGDFSDINKRINDLLIQTSSDAYTKQEAQILKAIKAGRFTPRKKDVQFFNINDNKLNMLLERTKADFTRAEFAILRKAEDEYRQIIFDAQVYGNVTNNYAKAVDMATHDYIKNGIQCVQYKGWTDKNGKYHKGAVHDITSYSEMAIRTANKRAYLMGEGNARDEYGVHTVQVNKRNDACPLCVRYLGKVLVDDVYSGGTREEAVRLQVPTLSDAIADGFLHPNCKDMYSTYLEGISKPAVPWNREEVERIVTKYDQGRKEERAQDMVDSYRRMAKLSLDPENQARYQARADIWQDRLDELKNTPIPPVIPPKPQTFVSQIDFADGIKQEDLIKRLDSEYINHTTKVVHGAHKAGGSADLAGTIHISNSDETTAIHEFAHGIASAYRTKVGLGREQDAEFWKELKKIHRRYLRETEGKPELWISTYEHGSRDISEFMAEAFTQQKMLEYGIPLPKKYGRDTTYSKQVLDLIDKYYKKQPSAKTAEAVTKIAETADRAKGIAQTTIIEEAIETKAPVFTPATTIQEAEEYAKTFTDTGRFGALGVSYDGVSVDVANIVNKTVGDFFSEYDVEAFGGIIAPKGNTKLGKLVDGATAGYSPIRHSFLLNRKSLKDIKIAEKALKKEAEVVSDVLKNPNKYDLSKMSARARKAIEASAISGRGTVPMTVEEVLWHELGHSLEKKISKLPNYDVIKTNMKAYAPKISGYATDSVSEYIAESFCSYKKGEKLVDPELINAFESLRR